MYLREGSGENRSNFIVFFEGGGWCESPEDCLSRSKTALGSSVNYSSSASWSQRDLLDVDCAKNSRFCSWSSAYLPYCDGASRSGAVEGPVDVSGTPLYYAGSRVLNVTLETLLSAAPGGSVLPAFPSLADASVVLVSGSSAGGLSTYLHVDRISDALAVAAPSAQLFAAPEVGFFHTQGASIWGGERIMAGVFERVAVMQNVSGGPSSPTRERCLAATPAGDAWQCWFSAPAIYPFLRTPTFILNSAWDEWQTSNVLAPDTNTQPHVTTYAPFVPCIAAPHTGCNATQFEQWFGYGDQWHTALATARAAVSDPAVAARSGGFVTSCAIHTTAISGFSHRIKIAGVSMYEALGAWLDGGAPPTAGGHWTMDVPWPGDTTCPGPHEAAEAEAQLAAEVGGGSSSAPAGALASNYKTVRVLAWLDSGCPGAPTTENTYKIGECNGDAFGLPPFVMLCNASGASGNVAARQNIYASGDKSCKGAVKSTATVWKGKNAACGVAPVSGFWQEVLCA